MRHLRRLRWCEMALWPVSKGATAALKPRLVHDRTMYRVFVQQGHDASR